MTQETGEHGPKMKALPNDRWRAFATIYSDQADKNATAAYAQAFGHPYDVDVIWLRVNASKLMNDGRMQAALLELAQAKLGSLAPTVARVLRDALNGSTDLKKGQISVAKDLADRLGMAKPQEIVVTHQNIGEDISTLQRIMELAQRMGLDPEKLVGHRVAQQMKAIEVEYTEIIEEPETW